MKDRRELIRTIVQNTIGLLGLVSLVLATFIAIVAING